MWRSVDGSAGPDVSNKSITFTFKVPIFHEKWWNTEPLKIQSILSSKHRKPLIQCRIVTPQKTSIFNRYTISVLHKSPPLYTDISHINPAQNFTFYSLKMLFNIIPICMTDSESDIYSTGFKTKICYRVLISPTHSTCPTNLIFLQLIAFVIYSLFLKWQYVKYSRQILHYVPKYL